MSLWPTQGEKNASVQQPLSMETSPYPLSSRGADLPAASQEWNERVDIEPLPTHERSRFVSGHDFSRAAHSPQRWALAPVPISSTFCSLGAYPDFLLHGSHQRPLMWFSPKRTTCTRPKPQLSTGNLGKPRDLQFRGPFVEAWTLRVTQNCHLDRSVPGFPATRRWTRPCVRLSSKKGA
jgi:hypothetical protein